MYGNKWLNFLLTRIDPYFINTKIKDFMSLKNTTLKLKLKLKLSVSDNKKILNYYSYYVYIFQLS